MEKKNKLIENFDKLINELGDHTKFINLFSKDEGKKTLARIAEAANKMRLSFLLSHIKDIRHPTNKALETDTLHKNVVGKLVKIKPCNPEYGDKTYLGFYLGDMSLGSSISIEHDAIVCSWSNHNPAIFVPELGKIIYGVESWWGVIKSEEELKEITKEDISNVWYVKAAKELMEKEKDE